MKLLSLRILAKQGYLLTKPVQPTHERMKLNERNEWDEYVVKWMNEISGSAKRDISREKPAQTSIMHHELHMEGERSKH